MKVLINGLQIGKSNSGVQYYTKHLQSAIQKIKQKDLEIHLYPQSTKPSFSPDSHRNSVFRLSLFLFPFFRIQHPQMGRLLRIFNENFYLPKYLKHKKYHLYHSPNYVLPLFIKSISIITVHDLIIFDYPKLCQRESVMYFRLFLPRSIINAEKIIAVSETTKKDIINRFKIPENKIDVVHLGVSPIFRRVINPEILTRYKIIGKYLLFVGNIEPKKNLVRLLKAFHKLICTKSIKHKLVIVGKEGWKYKEIFKTVKLLKLQDKVVFTKYVPEDDLPVLYSMAEIFVFPSIYEGFGIPPLEAMACETPVLASNSGALPETTGGNCLMVDPYSVDDITNGIYSLLVDEKLRRNYIERGKKWVEQFTWIITAQKTMEIYRQVEADSIKKLTKLQP